MNKTTKKKIRERATSIRTNCLAMHGSIDGACREISISLALVLDNLDEPVCVCQGTVHRQDHVWCRVGNTIVDATADQFPGSSDPITIKEEQDARQYEEQNFLIINSFEILALLRGDG